MLKNLNLKKSLAILTASFTIISIPGCAKKIEEPNETSCSHVTDEACELIISKEKLSDDLINRINSYDIGLIDYINSYTNFQDEYIPYNYELDECNYFNKIPESQRKIIYDFAYDYTQYLQYYQSNDVENIRKYIVRMVNDKREFGNMRCALLKTLPNELCVEDDEQIIFGTNNYIGPLEPSDDYSDYLAFIYMYNPVISKQIGKISVNSMNYDVIDREIAQFTLFIHLYMKYAKDPIQVIKLSDERFYLANEKDFNLFIEKNQDNYESNNIRNVLKSFTIEKRVNTWILKSNDKVFKEINSKILIEYLNQLSKKYNKINFNYDEMEQNQIIKGLFCDISIQDSQEEDNIENYWWPIGSTETEKIDGIEFATGIPEETYLIDKYSYIAGKNGVGVTNIIASKSGEVIYPKYEDQVMYENGSTEGGKYGNYVIIKHKDGNYTLYAHLSQDSITVFAGDYVEQGQVIGKMGKSGNAFDNYLEFEIRVGKNNEMSKVNIKEYINIEKPREISKKEVLINNEESPKTKTKH